MNQEQTTSDPHDNTLAAVAALYRFKTWAMSREETPFDLLQRDIDYARHEFMRETYRQPKFVFLGFEQMRAFGHMPPWLIRRDEAMVDGLEVIRAIKDSFLRVA